MRDYEQSFTVLCSSYSGKDIFDGGRAKRDSPLLADDGRSLNFCDEAERSQFLNDVLLSGFVLKRANRVRASGNRLEVSHRATRRELFKRRVGGQSTGRLLSVKSQEESERNENERRGPDAGVGY
jgi:hypothetical protein